MPAATASICAVCQQQAYRNAAGRMLMHTRVDYNAAKRVAVICEGSDRGARP
jgi:hypothetical protein